MWGQGGWTATTGSTAVPAGPPVSKVEQAYKDGYDAGFDEATFIAKGEIDRLKAELVIVKRRLTDSGR